MRLHSKTFLARTLVRNAFRNNDVWYVVEPTNWAIRQVGQALIDELNSQRRLRAAVTTTSWNTHNTIVHYGSLHTAFSGSGHCRLSPRAQKNIVSVFHIASDDHVQRVRELASIAHRFHTSSAITRQQLLSIGIARQRISIIPLGISTGLYTPRTPVSYHAIRASLGISSQTLVVGSFQKDGIGWGVGLKPKQEKGPDLLVDTVTQLAQDVPVHVLLVGPARGYVMARLRAANVPFTYIGYLPRAEQVAPYYHALDLYLISSRTEGGPLSALEAWASGVQVASTPVGMIPELTHASSSIHVSPGIDAQSLANTARSVLETHFQDLSHLPERTGLAAYDWSAVAARYSAELYA